MTPEDAYLKALDEASTLADAIHAFKTCPANAHELWREEAAALQILRDELVDTRLQLERLKQAHNELLATLTPTVPPV